jgi:hypothetical protein
MGQKKSASKKVKPVFHSASMLSEVYRSIPDPDGPNTSMPIKAIFGEIFNRGCHLNPGSDTYSSITSHKSGNNLFQGDLVNYDMSHGGIDLPKHRLSMILSHSCSITNSNFVFMVPVYLESELDQKAVEFFKGQSTPNYLAVVQNWIRNENLSFIGLPTVDLYSSGGDKLVACLQLGGTVTKNQIPVQPELRLTYRALSYVQSRIALFYLRDVQDSDETRDM